MKIGEPVCIYVGLDKSVLEGILVEMDERMETGIVLAAGKRYERGLKRIYSIEIAQKRVAMIAKRRQKVKREAADNGSYRRLLKIAEGTEKDERR